MTLSQRTSFAIVAVALEQAEDSGGALGGAIDDMVGLLEGALALALRLLGVMIPVAILAAPVGMAARAARRRRRESVLA